MAKDDEDEAVRQEEKRKTPEEIHAEQQGEMEADDLR